MTFVCSLEMRFWPVAGMALVWPDAGLRQRPTQACGTNVRDSVTVLVGGVRADLAVLGHSDDSTDDHPTQEQRDYYQPSPGRS